MHMDDVGYDHPAALAKAQRQRKRQLLTRRVFANYELYLLFLPVLAYYIIFHFFPMYGVLIAFKDYYPGQSIWGSQWVGLANYERFFSSYYFGRILKNTVTIRLFQIAVGFPVPIILAILLNEAGDGRFRKAVQNLTFIPHFFSTVVIVSVLTIFCQLDGLFNIIRQAFGLEQIIFLQKASWFKPLYVLSGVWQNMGWNSLIYIGALVAIDNSLYEAASIDGATRMQKIRYITLPCLLPTIVVLFIMNLGSLMNVGFDKVLLMRNDLNKEASDIISVFVYERGILQGDYGFATAVGLFNSVINMVMLVLTNRLSKLATGSSIW